MYMNECIICLCAVDLEDVESDMGSPLTQDIPCKCIYSVHETCLSKWLKMKFSCPMCGTVPIGINASSDSQDSSDNPREHLLSHRQVSVTAVPANVCATCFSTVVLIFFIWLLVKVGSH